jgi:hypothetical protein
MQAIMRCLAAAAFVAGAVVPASAHYHRPPACWQAGPGLVLKLSHYQQPDGTYDSLSDFTRSVNGTPCGIDCPAPSPVIFASPPAVYCEPY